MWYKSEFEKPPSIQPLSAADHLASLRVKSSKLKEKIAQGGHGWNTERDTRKLLSPNSQDYASFPSEVLETMRNLGPSSTIIDGGCGLGVLLQEIAGIIPEELQDVYENGKWQKSPPLITKDIRRQLKRVIGTDLFRHKEDPVTHAKGISINTGTHNGIDVGFIESDIYDNLRNVIKKRFPDFNGAEMVLSSALFYHLSDPYLALRNTLSIVKPGGLLAISTLPRIIDNDYTLKTIENSEGTLKNPVSLFDREKFYGQYDPVIPLVTPGMNLVPFGQLGTIIQQFNRSLHVDFSIVPADVMGRETVGARYAIHSLSNDPLSFDFLFYANAIIDFTTKPVVIAASSQKEIDLLNKKGFETVEKAFSLIHEY